MKSFCLPRTSSIHWFFALLYLAPLLLPAGTSAQTIFPVQSSLQLLPPYSVYLSDYAQPGAEKLRVILLQRDLSQAAYSLRLVFSVELNGRVILRTSRLFNPPPLPLDPGVPTVISGADLAPYLDSRNLEFVGYSREQYERTRALPEGSYRICVSAYDYRRPDVPVAAEACNSYFLAKSEPPLINYPSCGTKIPAKPVQQVVFSWLPCNTASANSVATTEYEFSLFEVRLAGRNVNDLVLTSRPVYQVSTDYTQLVYGAGEPTLQEGMQYVWRVQAKDQDGKDLFRNNGYSEVCSFTYGGVDPAFVVGGVKGFKAAAQAERKATLSWQVDQKGFEGYRVEYKKAGAGYEWFKTDTREGELKVFDLEPDTGYEARVQGQVKGVYGPYSEVVTFRTPKTRVVACGENVSVAQLQQGKPLAFATPGMSIQARGMEVILEEVEHLPEDGFYKGTGRVSIHYLGGAAFAVKFDRIYIDEDRNVVSGRIDVLSNSNRMTDVVAWATEAFKPLTEKLDDLLNKLKEPQENKEQIATAIDDYIEHVQAFIEKNPQLPDSVPQQLREDALLLETSKGGYLAATDQASTGMIIATIEQQVEQAKDRIAAIKEQVGNGSNGFDKRIATGKKSKLIAMISDTIMKEGKVFIYNGVSKQMKVKFETTDAAKGKMPYRITIVVESSNKTMVYPKTGYDTLVYNQVKEITLDSIPQGKYTVVCGFGKDEQKMSFFIRKQKLEITKEQLKAVFENTDTATLAKIVKTINNYSSTFGINTKDRMVHFLAQTGHESGGFKDPKGESGCYSSKNPEGWRIWFQKTWAEPPFGTDCDSTLNAVVKGSKKMKWTALVCDSTDKKCVKVPEGYICSSTNSLKGDGLTKKLFSYVYQCEGGNGNSASEDGYKYRGHGAIQLTWKKNYESFDRWLKINCKDEYKDVVTNPKAIDNSKELFILSAMWFWNTNNLNKKADANKFDDITRIINSASHGKADRLRYVNTLKNQIE